MSQNSSTQSSGSGPDFILPDEILAVIPTDAYDQLDLARKITAMAIASRVSNLESEVGNLKQKAQDKDRCIAELQEKVSNLESACQEAESRLKLTLEDNRKLIGERDSLAMTTKKLSRDLSKLETFKRQLMQSLNDDSASGETVDIVTCDQSVSTPYPKKVTDEASNVHTANRSLNGSLQSVIMADDVAKQGGNRYSMMPYGATPKIVSTNGSPKKYSAAASPYVTSRSTSPSKTLYDGRGSLSSWYPSSQQSSAANSPPRGHSAAARAPRIDGKEFFRQARSRLSYEQFSAFLSNIKELNAHKQSREETLKKAEDIFGKENSDLYSSFQGLLTRNVR